MSAPGAVATGSDESAFRIPHSAIVAALAVIEVDSPVTDTVLDGLRAIEPVILVKQVKL